MTAPSTEVSLRAPDPHDHRNVRTWVARSFRLTARIEAFTWVGLLIGMAFKYVISDNEIGVKVFGPLHGGAFIAYVLATVLTARTFRWSKRLLLVGLLASIPPAFTWPFERYASRRGRLATR